jgi:hypothetical protein
MLRAAGVQSLAVHAVFIAALAVSWQLVRPLAARFGLIAAPARFVCVEHATDDPRGMRSWNRYLADDGATLWYEEIEFPTAAGATASLSRYVPKPSTVLECGVRQSATKMVLGRYALASFERDGSSTVQATWAAGSRLKLVEGPSVAHVRALMDLLDGAVRSPSYAIPGS